MSFHVGQKVICVNGRARTELGRKWIYGDGPTEGAIYTVSAIFIDYGEECIALLEHPRSWRSSFRGFAVWRFRPIQSTSISEILAQSAPKDSHKWDNRKRIRTKERVS